MSSTPATPAPLPENAETFSHSSKHSTPVPGTPTLREAIMHLAKPNDPQIATIKSNELCSSKKAAGFVRHVEIDLTGTTLAGKCISGQSLGVIAEGTTPDGKPHKLRLYSLSSPIKGEDGNGNVVAVTVKRAIDEHWDNHKLFLGVCSNYLCDLQPGDKVRITGPAGKSFVLPANVNDHDYVFVSTGTGIAPFRGFVIDLLESGCKSTVHLIAGSAYSTDLLYHDFFVQMAAKYPNFKYHTAISREKNGAFDRLYVQDRFRTNADELAPILASQRTLMYLCGLAGMELGIFQELATRLSPDHLRQYLQCDADALTDIRKWNRQMIHKQIKPTKRILMEVYA